MKIHNVANLREVTAVSGRAKIIPPVLEELRAKMVVELLTIRQNVCTSRESIVNDNSPHDETRSLAARPCLAVHPVRAQHLRVPYIDAEAESAQLSTTSPPE